MTASDHAAQLSGRLRPEVAGFGVGAYSLLDDLTHLQGVRQAGAVEATIFYCARILEVLAAAAVQTVGMTPSASPFSNLEALAQFNLMPATTQYWANGLRRLGNEVRHVLRRMLPLDADLAALFTERWIDWFFCRFRFGATLPSVTVDAAALLPSSDPALPALLRQIDQEDFDPAAWLPGRWSGGESPYMVAATIAAVVANILLDHGQVDGAFDVLEAASAKFPEDLRLWQLTVLAWKRRGELEKALQSAGPLLARSRDDDETAGIVAGVYKQLYLDRGRQGEFLHKSHRAYLSGWEGSKNSNAYLGINAAACALWLGRPAESRRLAGEVKHLLLKRMQSLGERQRLRQLEVSYWDQVTLAEAQLLLGEFAQARARYQAAFANAAKARGNIKVAADQADRLLAPLGLTLTAAEFFGDARSGPGAVRPQNQVLVGITGHRSLPEESALRRRLIEIIKHLQTNAAGDGGPAQVVLLSSLAAGADCLAAEVVLDDLGGVLWAALPLELAEYRRDFSTEELPRFQRLLNRAEVVTYPLSDVRPRGKAPQAPAPPTSAEIGADERNAAYERVGFYVADQCHVLVAIWDGKPARGRGGTAEIVQYARQIRRRLIWLGSEQPMEVVYENQ